MTDVDYPFHGAQDFSIYNSKFTFIEDPAHETALAHPGMFEGAKDFMITGSQFVTIGYSHVMLHFFKGTRDFVISHTQFIFIGCNDGMANFFEQARDFEFKNVQIILIEDGMGCNDVNFCNSASDFKLLDMEFITIVNGVGRNILSIGDVEREPDMSLDQDDASYGTSFYGNNGVDVTDDAVRPTNEESNFEGHAPENDPASTTQSFFTASRQTRLSHCEMNQVQGHQFTTYYNVGLQPTALAWSQLVLTPPGALIIGHGGYHCAQRLHYRYLSGGVEEPMNGVAVYAPYVRRVRDWSGFVVLCYLIFRRLVFRH